MAAPVRPSDFLAIVNKPEHSLGTKFVNTFIRLPILVYKLTNYMFEGPFISPDFDRDLCAITCPNTEETTQ